MKKNDYKACIEHISPDRHFKTRLKEKVLTSGHKVKKNKRKWSVAAVSAVVCAAVLAVCLTRFADFRPAESSGNGQGETSAESLHFGMTVYAANGDSNKTELQLGSKLPLLYNIAVVDLRGLSDKAAEEKMKEAENAQIHTINRMNEDRSALIRQSSSAFENAYIHIVQLNAFEIEPDGKKQISSIRLQCGRYGQIRYWDCRESVPLQDRFPEGSDLEISADTYYEIMDSSSGTPLKIWWNPSQEMLDALSQDPARPVSAFTDTLIFTVNYTDGSTERCTIDLQFDENGTMNATYTYIGN